VHDVLETVDRYDLALTTLERSTSDGNLVVLADGDGTDLREQPDVLGTITPRIVRNRNRRRRV